MKKFLLFIFLFNFSTHSFSQTQKALVIGIDAYAAPKDIKPSGYRSAWPTLDGCKNDALSVKAVITQSFGFTSNNVKELYDTAATRDAILNAIDELLNGSATGDIAFIYYAGHGSQVKNSLSTENDLKDESIVPANTWKEGVGDIRDKELAKICNRFIDKGIKLTLVFDCCHSGSIARGLYQPKYRFIAESNVDAKDNSNPVPPETRKRSGYLVLSAAQDNEYAQEQIDDNNIPHGAFTLALVRALNQESSKASVQNIFNSVRAILKSNGKSQEPVLAGDTARFNETLFGLDKAQIPGKKLFPVMKVNGSKLVLQGGFAAGINVDNELTRINNNDTTRILVTKLLGINQSEAELLKGNAAGIIPGQLFEVTNWVSSNTALLKIFIPGGNYSYVDVTRLAAIDAKLKKQDPLNWMNTFDKTTPDIAINIANNKFIITDYAKGLRGSAELKDFNITEVNRFAKGKKLFVNLPAPKDLANAIQFRFKDFKTIQFVKDPSAAQYILYGTIDNNGRPAYGLFKSDLSLNDSLSSMPTYTATVILDDSSAASYQKLAGNIFENALKLSKIRGWINIVAPVESDFFPYHLIMRNRKTKKEIGLQGVKIGDPLSLNIEADEDYLDKNVRPRYIYVFIIDSKGQMQLLYPSASEGSNENKFPFQKEGHPVNRFIVREDLEAADPVGTDNYFLLASSEQITGYDQVFNQEGVRGIKEANSDPLSRLLDMGNESSARGLKNTTATNWTLKRLFVVTKH